ncbi:sce7726 family protein [Pseudomonas syringae]|nr:sce7726 family protein [Pseudomonas syringae]MCF5244490.1 sce7726 family protein [Pseudomonas syringae]
MMTPNEIKSLLRQWIVRSLPHGDGDALIDELCFVDKARRADVVHANGKLSAFEIKSHADTLLRWSGQQDAYLSCFDEVWLCCHSKHLVKALEVTHGDVGIILVDDLGGFAIVRRAKLNKKVSSYNLTGFLWRDQLDEFAKENGVKVSSKMRIKDVRRQVSDETPQDLLRNLVISVLKERYGNQMRSSKSSGSFPAEES